MIYLTTFFEMFSKLWWIFPAMFLIYFIYYFLRMKKTNLQNKNEVNNEDEKEKRELFQVYESDEKKYLDIDFDERSVVEKLPIAKELILNLQEGKPFYIKSAEAVYIADKIEKELKLDENGVMVVEKNDALRMAQLIQYDPTDLVRYMLAMEKKLDPKNSNSKISLGDFLFLARNARNFNLLAYGSEAEKKDGDALIKMKTAIYNSWFDDVQVNIEDQDVIDERKPAEHQDKKDEIIYESTGSLESDSSQEYSTVDPVTGEVNDPSILKVEKLEGNKIRIYTKTRQLFNIC